MTKAEKISLLKEMLLIERDESAVTGSRLSIFPLVESSNADAGIARVLAKKAVAKKAGLTKKLRAKTRSARAKKAAGR